MYKPPGGAYIWRGHLTKGFLRYEFGGLIFGGAYTWKGLFWELYGTLINLSACLQLTIVCKVVWGRATSIKSSETNTGYILRG